LAKSYLEELKDSEKHGETQSSVLQNDSVVVAEPEQTSDVVVDSAPDSMSPQVDELIMTRTGNSHQLESTTDVPMRFREKKRLNWTGKTCESVFQVFYEKTLSQEKPLDLAPLTTVGNFVC